MVNRDGPDGEEGLTVMVSSDGPDVGELITTATTGGLLAHTS